MEQRTSDLRPPTTNFLESIGLKDGVPLNNVIKQLVALVSGDLSQLSLPRSCQDLAKKVLAKFWQFAAHNA
ncbi:hypothetical protein [Ruegeria sp. HKCCA5426]|uniref:hypothetical protein n=1 Tax=Ruegeria sp. HKCCA5426 TaxID=2682985 RepID=UPI0014879460|nr:hypothetical protein [Ruegeria sp. HKCCA5426]